MLIIYAFGLLFTCEFGRLHFHEMYNFGHKKDISTLVPKSCNKVNNLNNLHFRASDNKCFTSAILGLVYLKTETTHT